MSDRERDARIAEGLFGWVSIGDGKYQTPEHVGSPVFTRDLPHYSTGPVNSKKLREKLAERFPFVELTRSPAFGLPLFRCFVSDTIKESFQDRADTEERAVVACAIKLLDAKEGLNGRQKHPS